MPRRDDPFKFLDKVNGNAFKLELHEDVGVSYTFNAGDLMPYFEDEDMKMI